MKMPKDREFRTDEEARAQKVVATAGATRGAAEEDRREEIAVDSKLAAIRAKLAAMKSGAPPPQ